VAQDSATLHVKDVEERATLAERKALKRVSRVEVEDAATLASANEDAKHFVQKIALLEGELAALHHNEMARELATLQVAVFSTAESKLGCSPNDTFHVEVVSELVAKF
jgi:hypothetical protein